MKDGKKEWRTYEEVAQHLLTKFANHFGLGYVEGKQVIPGASGTEWEIEAKGVAIDGKGFIIIECRRYTTARISQEEAGGLAYRIIDTGAKGGILVTPLGFQKGAKKVVSHSGIKQVILNPTSTTTDYILQFLNNVFVGLSDTIPMNDSVIIKKFEQGKIIDERHCK